MKSVAEFQKTMEEMTEEEILEFIQHNRRSRETSTSSRVKRVKAKTKEKNFSAFFASLSPEERAKFTKDGVTK